ncbi:hypothetical protein A2U01_0110409, partial [Trifolium medium]|nr:hypothetical protein [Trifolium medium]
MGSVVGIRRSSADSLSLSLSANKRGVVGKLLQRSGHCTGRRGRKGCYRCCRYCRRYTVHR